MLVNPFRNKWVVAKDFSFRGCLMRAGTVFRVRSTHPRVWARLINDGSLVKQEDFVAEPKKEEPVKVAPQEVPTEAPVEKQETEPKKASKKKSTKKEK